jgi:NADH-quinone oxidoreductase subunit I
MALAVQRPKLTLSEKLYLPAIAAGLMITLRHFVNRLTGRTLVTDEWGRERCVACQLCEFICPPRAITIKPEEIPAAERWGKVEKRPKAFDIDMIRCIYCGLCQEVCPEQAIFLRKDYSITGYSRAEMNHDKAKLYELGGVMPGLVNKWNEKK